MRLLLVSRLSQLNSARARAFTQYLVDTVYYSKEAAGNTITHWGGGGGELFGLFEGIWIHDEWIVEHPNGKVTMNGVWDSEHVTFNAPDGPYYGDIHVRYTATADATGFQGRFVIISGTDDLENLRGQGIMWADLDGVHYTIQYHFDPR